MFQSLMKSRDANQENERQFINIKKWWIFYNFCFALMIPMEYSLWTRNCAWIGACVVFVWSLCSLVCAHYLYFHMRKMQLLQFHCIISKYTQKKSCCRKSVVFYNKFFLSTCLWTFTNSSKKVNILFNLLF